MTILKLMEKQVQSKEKEKKKKNEMIGKLWSIIYVILIFNDNRLVANNFLK